MQLNLVTTDGQEHCFGCFTHVTFAFNPHEVAYRKRMEEIDKFLSGIRWPTGRQLFILQDRMDPRGPNDITYYFFAPDKEELFKIDASRTSVTHDDAYLWNLNASAFDSRFFAVYKQRSDDRVYEIGYGEAAGEGISSSALLRIVNKYWK